MAMTTKKEIGAANVPAMLNPATGSANPAASPSALWAYIRPALDHIIKSSPNVPDGKAPSIDIGFYSGIHTACYNYFTSHGDVVYSGAQGSESQISTNADIYGKLDGYFEETTRELFLGAPHDDATLIDYIIPCFNRYTSGARSVNRLLSYMNRCYVKRAADEDKGWVQVKDILEPSADKPEVAAEYSREMITKQLRLKRLDELEKWGYQPHVVSEPMAVAEACAEAASPLDRIVPIISMAHRRFRTEVFEPLLAVPKTKAKSKAKANIPRDVAGSTPTIPKGRLARAVKMLLESKDIEEERRIYLAKDLATTLKTVGIRTDHPLRKRLEKFIASSGKDERDSPQ